MKPRSKPHIWCEQGQWRVMYAWLPGLKIRDFDDREIAMAFATEIGRLMRLAGVAHD